MTDCHSFIWKKDSVRNPKKRSKSTDWNTGIKPETTARMNGRSVNMSSGYREVGMNNPSIFGNDL